MTSSRWPLLVVVLAGVACVSAGIFFLKQSSYFSGQISQNLASGISTELSQRLGLPTRLKIPKISVDAAVMYVGLTSQGAMDVPKGPGEVAWFNLGPRPGEKGSAVIAGHYGWKNGIPAVFDNLSRLRKGDTVYSQDEKGVITTFVVRDVRTYGEHEDVPGVFGSNDDGIHLNLITCGGVWNKDRKSYSQRIVVFSDKK